MARDSILESVLYVPSISQLGNIVSVGPWCSGSHPGPSFFLFFLFIQQPIINSHSNKQENTGDNKEDSTALVRVLVIMIDVLKLSCKDKSLCNYYFEVLYVSYICESISELMLSPSNGGPNSTGPHSTMVTRPTALEKRCAPTRSIKVSKSTELSQPKANPKKIA